MKCMLLTAIAVGSVLADAQAHSCTFLTANQEDPLVFSRQEILKNPDVLWAGEGFFTYMLDERNPEKFQDKELLKSLGINGKHTVSPLKDLHDRRKPYPYNSTDMDMIHRLLSVEYLQQAEIFADPALQQRIPAKQAIRFNSAMDTIMVMDPATGKSLPKIVITQTNPGDLVGYQAKQLVYFDQKQNCFQSVIEAVAPLMKQYDGDGNPLGIKPLFWMKVQTESKAQDLNNADVPWARYSARMLSISELTVIKNQKPWADCMQQHFDQVVKNAGKEDIRNTLGDLEKLSPSEIQYLTAPVDTIITYDPKTFEQTITVQKYEFKGKSVEKIRFLTEWVWDDRKKQMICFTSFSAPIVPRFDNAGTFLFEGPLFYKGL